MAVTSSINPLLPLFRAPLDSAALRNNFLAAYNDITGLLNFGYAIPDDAIQVETAAGTITVAAATQILVLNKALLSNTPCNLPSVLVRRDKLWLWVFDFTGLAGDVTMTPSGVQSIMGASTPKIVFASGGAAQTGGAAALFPLRALTGWLVK